MGPKLREAVEGVGADVQTFNELFNHFHDTFATGACRAEAQQLDAQAYYAALLLCVGLRTASLADGTGELADLAKMCQITLVPLIAEASS